MASKRDRRRIGAATATVFTGAFVFCAAGAGPASAEMSTASADTECVLGSLLCGILGGKKAPAPAPTSPGGGKTKPPPKSSGGGTSTMPKSKPKPKSKRRIPTRPNGGGSGSGASGGVSVPLPFVPPGGVGLDTKGAPSAQRASALLPDVTSQDPQVVPETAGRARLVAATDPVGAVAVSPLLVATAAGLGGAVAAFNVSVLHHRRRLRRLR
jgi:hypothetical protein